VADDLERPCDRRQHVGGLAALGIGHDDQRFARERRHRALAGREAVLDVERLPRARLLVLSEAARVARGIAERGHADDAGPRAAEVGPDQPEGAADGDRKSTRLNSSHGSISYAVFCLKKKTKHYLPNTP